MDRYVDGTLAGTTATYNPLTRGTDGSSPGYKTLTAAHAAAAAADVLYCRAGECDSLSAQLTLSKALSIRRYESEDAFITVNDGDFTALSITAALTFGEGYGDTVRLVGGGPVSYSTSYRTFLVQASNAVIHADITDYKGAPFRMTGAIGGVTGSIKITNGKQPIVFNGTDAAANTFARIVLINCTTETGSGPGALQHSSGETIITELVLIGGGCTSSGSGMIVCANGTLTVTNALLVGNGANHGTATTCFRTAGTFTINGGIVNGNILDPLKLVSSGTITFNSVLFNQCVIPSEFQTGSPKKASFIAWDSNHADDASSPTAGLYSLVEWTNVFSANGKMFTYCPDDVSQFSVLKKTNVATFMAAGGELGAEAESSTSLGLATDSTNQPFSVYRSAGTGDVTIDIDTDSAMTATIKVDGVTQSVIDFEAVTLIGNEIVAGPHYLFAALNGLVVGTATLTVICTTPSTDPIYKNQFDDLPSACLATDEYVIGTTSGTATPIYVDRDKWFGFDIALAKSTLLGYFPTARPKTFVNYKMLNVPADAAAAIASSGYVNVFSGIPPGSRISGFNKIGTDFTKSLAAYRAPEKLRGDVVQSGIGLTAYSHGLATNEANIRSFVRAFCAAAITCSLYPVIELGRKTNTVASGIKDEYELSDDDVEWMLDEFSTLGFSVQPVGTAVKAFSTSNCFVKTAGTYAPATTTVKGSDLVGVFMKIDGSYSA